MRALRRALVSRRAAAAALAAMAGLLVLGQLVPTASPERLAALRADRPLAVWAAEHLSSEAVRGSTAFLALAGYVFAATAAGMVERFATRRRRRAVHERFVTRREVVLSGPAADLPQRIAGALARAGLPRSRVDGALVAGARGTLSFTGSLVFHGGLLVVMAGCWASGLGRFEGEVVLVEGAPLALSRATMLRASAGSLGPLEGLTLAAHDVAPDVSADDALRNVATVLEVARPGEAARRSVVQVNAPAEIDGYQISLSRYGFAPELEVTDADGRTRAAGVAVVRVLPPGTEDVVALDGGGELRVRFYPDFALVDGKPASRSRLPLAPVLAYAWVEGGREVASGLVRRGESHVVGGRRVAFASLRQWVDCVVVADPGLAWFTAGFLLICAGLALRFARSEQRWAAVLSPRAGETHVALTLSARYFPAGLEVLADRVAAELAVLSARAVTPDAETAPPAALVPVARAARNVQPNPVGAVAPRAVAGGTEGCK